MPSRRRTRTCLMLGALLLACALPAAAVAQAPARSDPFATFAAAPAALLASVSGQQAPPPPPPPPVAPQPSGSVGTSYHAINGQFLWDASIVGTGASADAYRNTQLDALRAEGLSLLRYGAPWSLSEPVAPVGAKHTYDWAFADTVARTLATKGVRWYPILGAPPQWAAGYPSVLRGCPAAFAAPLPSAVASFAAFARAFAARYGSGGVFWSQNPSLATLPVGQIELFNEPNLGCFFNTGADDAPARYAEIYATARAAIRSVAPQTTVVSGGLAPGPANAGTRLVEPQAFVTRMIAARPALKTGLDALGLHPYAPTAGQTFALIAEMRTTLDAATPGRRVPIEVNEAGWFTQGSLPGDFWGFVPPIGEAQRAAMLQALAIELPASDCVVTRFLPHTWISPELNPWSFGDWFGIVSRSGVKKASATSYGAGLRAARAATSATVLRRCT